MNRRRRYTPDWPEHLPRTRARLGRLMLLLGAAILLTMVGAARVRSVGAPGVTLSPTPAAIRTAAAATAGVTPATAPPATLEQRADGWYLAQPEAWPLVEVERVVDGDTLDVRAAQTALRVRMFGIDAPERGERCADEAAASLGRLTGRAVRLVADARQQDAFGRELRYVFTPDGRSLDAALLDAGLARAWREDGALQTLLVSIEAGARDARRGCLWAG